MTRKLLLLPAIAAALLAGCATYGYRNGADGDYYYGQPGTTSGYYGDGAYGYGYPAGYGYAPAWGGYGGYYGGYYGGGYYVPGGSWHGGHEGHDGHGGHDGHDGHGGHDGHDGHWHDGHGGGDHDGDHDGNGQGQDRPTPPWRDLGRLRELREQSQAAHERPVPRAPMGVGQERPTRAPSEAPTSQRRPAMGGGGNPKREPRRVYGR